MIFLLSNLPYYKSITCKEYLHFDRWMNITSLSLYHRVMSSDQFMFHEWPIIEQNLEKNDAFLILFYDTQISQDACKY